MKKENVKPYNGHLVQNDIDMLDKHDILDRALLILKSEIQTIEKRLLANEPTAEDLIRGECTIPPLLSDFYSKLICSSFRRKNNKNVQRVAQSFSADVIYAATKGKIKPSKHITLGMTLKGLTNSRKIINIINKYGHCCSYTVLEELENEATFASAQQKFICPENNTRSKNLSTGLAYVPWCQEHNIVPVRESACRKLFCTEYNIGFKLPKPDTCKTCNEINIKLYTARSNKDYLEVERLTTFINLHRNRAKAMQDLLKVETERSQNSINVCVISFDLQQALPIPKLTTGPAFYCRKVWLYNLGVHSCTTGQGHMYLWTENQAKPGADEVALVLFKFHYSKKEVDKLIIFTDNCAGQNKNWFLMAFWLQLVKEKKFKTITHHFLVSGHTHLPPDRDFALIEKRHRKYAPEIYSPEG